MYRFLLFLVPAALFAGQTRYARLGEMDVEPFLISASTVGVMAQRLARRLCQQCKEEVKLDEVTAAYLGMIPGETVFRNRPENRRP